MFFFLAGHRPASRSLRRVLHKTCLCLSAVKTSLANSGRDRIWTLLLTQFLLKLLELFDGNLLFLIKHLRDALDLFDLEPC